MTPKTNNELFNLKKSGEGKVVFITGGGGRIGRSLSRALIRNGYGVRALSHDKEFIHTMPAGVIPYVGDLNNKKVLSDACRGADIVYHLAAIVSEYREPTKKLMEVNVTGTENVLEACRKNGVEEIVFTSSVDVYGRARDEILTEESSSNKSHITFWCVVHCVLYPILTEWHQNTDLSPFLHCCPHFLIS